MYRYIFLYKFNPINNTNYILIFNIIISKINSSSSFVLKTNYIELSICINMELFSQGSTLRLKVFKRWPPSKATTKKNGVTNTNLFFFIIGSFPPFSPHRHTQWEPLWWIGVILKRQLSLFYHISMHEDGRTSLKKHVHCFAFVFLLNQLFNYAFKPQPFDQLIPRVIYSCRK